MVRALERLRRDFPMWGKAKLGLLLRAQGHAVFDSTAGRILKALVARGVVQPVPHVRRQLSCCQLGRHRGPHPPPRAAPAQRLQSQDPQRPGPARHPDGQPFRGAHHQAVHRLRSGRPLHCRPRLPTRHQPGRRSLPRPPGRGVPVPGPGHPGRRRFRVHGHLGDRLRPRASGCSSCCPSRPSSTARSSAPTAPGATSSTPATTSPTSSPT